MEDKKVEDIVEQVREYVCENTDDESYDFLPIECNELENCKIDAEDFQKGLDNISFVCGQVTGLINIGFTPSQALEYVINLETIAHNLDVTNIGAKASVECAKIAAIKAEFETL